MTHVSTLFPVDKMWARLEAGLIREQTHPTLPLRILNYTEKTAFDKRWDEVTLNCRGLILDNSNNIIARPWKKFFNYGEGRLMIDDVMPVEVTDKMDGSLGILYPTTYYDGQHYSIATRGSFASDQAIHASEIWWDKYADETNVPEEYTFLFEIVYPENRIVLDYKGLDDLVLLGAVSIEYGYYVGPRPAAALLDWTGPVTKVFEARSMAEAFAMPERLNAEGVVVRSGTEMVKIKQDDYVQLHRIVTNLSERTVWAHYASGGTLEQLLERVPDEWHDWLKKVTSELMASYKELGNIVLEEFMSVAFQANWPRENDRKAFAVVATKSKFKKYLFQILDKKSVNDLLWQDIKPRSIKNEKV